MVWRIIAATLLCDWCEKVRRVIAGELPRTSWELVFEQHPNREHLHTRPRTRYSHSSTTVGGEVVVMLGYFYDQTDGGRATWHRDAWALSAPGGVGRWRRIWDGSTPGPPGKMNHAAALHPDGESVVVFGGTGSSKKREKHDDLWQLHVASGEWQQLAPANAPPPGRDCFSAVVAGDLLVIYGGFHLSDVWSFSFRSLEWRMLSERPKEDSPDHPGVRSGHSAVAAPDGARMFVYGGYRFESDVTDPARFPYGRLGDLWLFDIGSNRWQQLPQAESPGNRYAFAMSLVPWFGAAAGKDDDVGLAVFGGTLCNPVCNLTGRLDFFSLITRRWTPVDVAERPLHRYYHSMSFSDGYLWTFGGESFNPYMYHNGVLRLGWPPSALRPAPEITEL